jgi:hypothetical protein
MPSKKKGKQATKKPSSPRKRPPKAKPTNGPDEDIEISVHLFDCTLDPPSFNAVSVNSKRKDLASITLVIATKGGLKFTQQIPLDADAIFLTTGSRDKWKKHVPRP